MKTITLYLCEACTRPISPGCGVILADEMDLITDGDRNVKIIAGKSEHPTAYHTGCLIKLMNDEVLREADVRNIDYEVQKEIRR